MRSILGLGYFGADTGPVSDPAWTLEAKILRDQLPSGQYMLQWPIWRPVLCHTRPSQLHLNNCPFSSAVDP